MSDVRLVNLLRLLACSGLLLPGSLASTAQDDGPLTLPDVKTWMFQFQSTETEKSIERLAGSAYDLLVVEPNGTYRSGKNFDMKAFSAKLHAGRRRRIVLAYLNLGEADSNRSYWEKGWKVPEKGGRGTPDFLLKADPDGWKDTYVVRYTDPKWQELVISDARKILAAGFDGLYLDWLEACLDKTVAQEVRGAALEPVRAMVDFVGLVRREARLVNSGAQIVVQNAPSLIELDPRLVDLVDGAAFEATWYGGKAEVNWDDREGGDRPNTGEDESSTTAGRLKLYAKWRAARKPVFTVDYCLSADHAREVYQASTKLGLIPLVSRTALDRLTETPPPALKAGGR